MIVLSGTTTKTISYDSAGNPTNYKGATLTWTRGRLLASYKPSGSSYTTTMQYDANGIRCSKTIPTSTQPNVFRYVYDGNNLVRETKSGISSYTKTFLYNSQGIVGFAIGSTVYTYRKNLFGDIIAIYQGATKKAAYLYDAWGNCTITQDTDGIGTANPFRYRGYYWDNDLQLYYLMSRYYDPQTGRFINADSLEYLDPETIGGLNLYAYCGNNPVMNIDPLGTDKDEWWKWIIVGAVAVTAVIAVFVGTAYSGGMLAPALTTMAGKILTTIGTAVLLGTASSIITQASTNGSQSIDPDIVATDMAISVIVSGFSITGGTIGENIGKQVGGTLGYHARNAVSLFKHKLSPISIAEHIQNISVIAGSIVGSGVGSAIASLLLGDQVVLSEAIKDEALSYFKDLLFRFIFRLEI